MASIFNFLAEQQRQRPMNVLPPVREASDNKFEAPTLRSENKKILAQSALEGALQDDIFRRLAQVGSGGDYAALAEAVLADLPDEAKQNFPDVKEDIKQEAKRDIERVPSFKERQQKYQGKSNSFQYKGSPFERRLVLQQLKGDPRDFDRTLDVAAEERLPELRFGTQRQVVNQRGQGAILNLLQRIGANLSSGVKR